MASTSLLLWLSAYLVVIAGIGIAAYFRIDDLDDYFLAGRNVPWWLLATTYIATITSAATFLALSGANYAFGYGPTVLWSALSIGAVIGIYFIGTKLRYFGEYTIPDYFGSRFDSDYIRLYSSLLVVFIYIVWVGSGVILGGVLFEQLLGWEYWWGVVFITVAFVAYTYFGGIPAVIWTDFVQGITFVLAAVLGLYFAIQSIGGFGVFIDQMMATDPQWFTYAHGGEFPTTNWLLIWMIGLIAKPAAITRMYTARSQKDIGKASVMIVILGAVTSISVLYIAGIVRVAGPELASPENAFIWGAQNLMPPIIGGWALAGILASMLSSADTQIMMMTMSVSRDMYKQVYKPDATDEEVQRLSRWLVLVFGVIVLVFGLIRPGLVAFLTTFAISVVGGAFVPSLILGMYWRRTTYEGALSSMLIATVAAVFLNGSPPLLAVPVGPPMIYVLTLGFLVCIVVSWFTDPSDKAVRAFDALSFSRSSRGAGTETGASAETGDD